MKYCRSLLILLVLALSFSAAAEEAAKDPQAMPPMGPPEEMKLVAFLVGTWDVAMKMKMNPTDTFWTDAQGTAKYELVYDGAALMSRVEQPMMGMTFIGGALLCYDRETKKWQTTWVDNMTARISLYTGTFSSTGSVFQGEDLMMGQSFINRLSTSNQKPTSFDWKGEMSMDGGKTWQIWATAKYTKRR